MDHILLDNLPDINWQTYIEALPVKRVAMLSVHTCPLAMLGGKKTGGMNVYVRDFATELARQGIQVDVFTRSQDDCVPTLNHDLGYGARVIHIPAGPEAPIPVADVGNYLDEFTAGVVDFANARGYPLRLDPQSLLAVRHGRGATA